MGQKKYQITFLLGGVPEPLIEKRINIALDNGEVSAICWDQSGKGEAISDDRYNKYIYSIRSSLNFFSRMIPYFRFRKKAIKKLKELEPDVLHVRGLHMAMIGYRYYKIAKKKPHLIYEVPDLLRMVVEPQKNPVKKIAQKYFQYMEKKCCDAADVVVVTSEKYYEVHFSEFVDRKKVFFFPNVPDLLAFENYRKKSHGEFTIGFIGVIRYKRELINLIEAAATTNTRLLIAGNEIDGNEVETALQGRKNIERIGRFNFIESASSLYEKCDAIFSVYNADLKNCRVALPNKLYESIYCELPIIVAKNTYLSELVERDGVGISVDHKSVEELCEAINLLKQKKLYDEIADHCKQHKADIDLKQFSTKYVSFVRSRIIY